MDYDGCMSESTNSVLLPTSEVSSAAYPPITVQKGVPIAPTSAGRPHRSKWDVLFDTTESGDSWFFAGENANRDANSILTIAKKRGVKLTTRRVVEDGVSGVRVWRL